MPKLFFKNESVSETYSALFPPIANGFAASSSSPNSFKTFHGQKVSDDELQAHFVAQRHQDLMIRFPKFSSFCFLMEQLMLQLMYSLAPIDRLLNFQVTFRQSLCQELIVLTSNFNLQYFSSGHQKVRSSHSANHPTFCYARNRNSLQILQKVHFQIKN